MKYIASALIILAVAGCAEFANVKNKVDAQLMPEVVAKKVLARYFGESWVTSPHGYHNPWRLDFNQDFCERGKKELPFREITAMGIQEDGKIIILQNQVGMGTFFSVLARQCPVIGIVFRYSNRLNEQDFNDIVDALVSLGAKIDEVKRE